MTSQPGASADIRLLERIVARDQAALAALYDRHCRLLFTLILRILKDRGEAEDVLQEVFVRVWDRADGYDPSLGGAGGVACPHQPESRHRSAARSGRSRRPLRCDIGSRASGA